MKKIFLTALFLYTLPVVAKIGDVLTLNEAYQQTLKQSESLAIQDETIRIAAAHYEEALGTVLPHLDVNSSELVQDTTSNSSGSSSSVTSTLTKRSRPEVALTLTQPLFQGFREFRALRISSVEKQKDKFDTQRARQLLFADVARAYYTVLEVEKELQIQQSIFSALQKRKGELENRVKLGRSRESELLSTESDSASTQADIEKTKGMVATARDMLGFLVGQPVKESLVDEFKVPAILPSLEKLEMISENRPDLGAAAANTRLAKGEVNYNKGALLPTLGLIGNYYPYRTGYQKNIKWDVNFGLTVPLFEGGALRGPIKESEAQLKQAQLTQQETNRQAKLELTQAYHNLTASQAETSALQLASNKAKANFDSLSNEYNLNLVNNLEVLDGLKTWHDKRVEANQIYFQTKLYYLDLLIASGQIPETLVSEVQP